MIWEIVWAFGAVGVAVAAVLIYWKIDQPVSSENLPMVVMLSACAGGTAGLCVGIAVALFVQMV